MPSFRMTGSFGPAGGTTNAPGRPTSIFLKKRARVHDRMNGDTAATARSSDGHILDVSIWIHHPPALSYFCARCHYRAAPESKPVDDGGAGFEDPPHVVAAEGRLALLRARFAYSSTSTKDEYFMYKAGFGEPAGQPVSSLDQVQLPDGYRLPGVSEFAVVPRGHGGRHYLLAWTRCATSSTPTPPRMKHGQESCCKIHSLSSTRLSPVKWSPGEGIIGWVDFQHGMLVCDLHETNPIARYMPLPDPLPGNKDKLLQVHPGPYTRRYRDLVCINGVLKLIEIEHHVVVATPKPSFPPKGGKVYDSDLIMSRQRKEPEPLETWDGWKAVMWSRTVSSDGWEMVGVLDAADIVFDHSVDLSLLSGLTKGEADDGKIAFKDLYSAFPTLSTDGDDILYLDSRLKFNDPDRLMVALDLGTKRVKAMAGDYPLAKHSPSVKTVGPCTEPHVTIGKVPASACARIKQEHSSAHDPNKTSICVGHPSSCESDNKRPRLSVEKVNHGHIGAQNILQNDHISVVRPAQNYPPSFNYYRRINYHEYKF